MAFGAGAESLNTPDDMATRNELLQAGRIFTVPPGTRAQVLSEANGIVSIQVTSGEFNGEKGMVSQYSLARPSDRGLEPIHQIPLYNPGR